MFKSGDHTVCPRQVETVIESIPGVQLCAVVPTPDAVWGEVGTAFVQGEPQTLSPARLREHCQALLARYEVPR